MALAILELIDFGEGGYDLLVDTGTNTHFELKLGLAVSRRAGARFADELFHQTPLTTSEGGGDPLAPPQAMRLDPSGWPAGRVQAQLFSYKPGRRSPAFSDVVELPPLGRVPPRRRPPLAAAQSVGQPWPEVAMSAAAVQVRRIPHRDLTHARTASLDTILAEVIKLAQPVVASVLKAPAGEAASDPAANIVASLLKAVLAAIPGAPAPAGQTQAPIAETKSLDGGNRFASPMIFGIDDVLIGAAIGEVVKILPQLANAANQKDKERRAADHAFTSGILKDINQRLLMDQVLEAQRQAALAANNAPAGGQGAVAGLGPEQLAALVAAIAQLPPQGTAPVAETKSLSRAASRMPAEPRATPAPRAVLEPLVEPPLDWIGGKDAVFARAARIALRFRFVVAAPVPAAPLAKALLKVTLVDDANAALRYEKTVKLTGIRPGELLECPFEPGELAHLPPGSRLTATAALRWPGKAGRPAYEALGSHKLVLAGPLFVKAQGGEVGAERELTDMRRWRPFWNKIWEAPTLDRGEDSKRRWRLDADARYTVALGVDARNGVMETRHRPPDQPEDDPDAVLTNGRLKAGIEIGVAPLAQLRALWDRAELPAEVQTALADRAFIARCGGEAQRRLELKGRAGERGLVWMVPTFRLFDIVLCRVAEASAAGQVTKANDETVQLPLPIGVRVLGLKSD